MSLKVHKTLVLISLSIIAFNSYFSACYGKEFEVLKTEQQRQVEEQQKQTIFAFAAQKSIDFHRNVISRIDGDRCSMTPSCSTYGKTAIKKHGFFAGLILTIDRLLREGDEYKVSPVVYGRDGKLYTQDPVANNDFWWNNKGHSNSNKEGGRQK